MDYKATITIDMEKYGMPGDKVVLGLPGMREKIDFANDISRRIQMEQTKTGIILKDVLQGDWSILKNLLYIRKAPFERTVIGFLNYADEMDAKKWNSASEFWEDVTEIVTKLDGGDYSPLESSPVQETLNTE